MKGIKLIYETSHSLIYLQANEGVKQRIIKVARNTLSTEKQLFYLQREYVLTQQLNHIQGVRNVLEETSLQDQYAIVLEYIPGQSLKDTFIQQRKPYYEIIDILIQITKIIGQVHSCNIIHKDLTSRNILISENTQGEYIVHLIDFALAASIEENKLYEKNPSLWAAEVELAGTWAYMAPEQTGRVNRNLDARTDLYALGINFYEMLTGKHPFVAQDPIEWVHAHLAQAPMYPREITPEVPESLADICMKLLQKNPANRYLSANSLQDDLTYLQNNLSENTSNISFRPASRKIKSKIELPDKYYNREQELEVLTECWDRVTQGDTATVLVSGYAGTGKTRFAQQLKSQVKSVGGYFIEGKFDSLTQNSPYSAWLQAFESFVNQIIVEKSSQLEVWKATIQQALGSNSKLLTDLLPKLTLIIGASAEITNIGIQEVQHRLNYVFQRFIDAISVFDHPLVMFIDDWQWADAASIELLKLLTQNKDNDFFLIICAYREQESLLNDPLHKGLEELTTNLENVSSINLNNWSKHTITEFIQDTLNCEASLCSPLAHIIYQKTQGNPFFAIQMVQTLYDKGLLIHKGHNNWEFDLENIGQLTISDNVASLLSENLQQLPPSLQNILFTASCIGDTFSFSILRHLNNLPPTTLQEHLNQLENENLLIHVDKGYRIAHHRLRTICYESLPESDRDILHVRIGLWMVSNLPTSEQEELLFDIVNHLNRGKHLLRDEEWMKRYNFDKLRLVVLNLKAALKSRSAVAWRNALDYIETGAQLLPSDAWNSESTITYQIYKNWAEIAFMSGDGKKAMELSLYALKHTESPIDQMHLYNVLIIYHNSVEDYKKAYYVGKEALRKLGFAIRDEWSIPMLEAKKQTVKQLIETCAIDNLIHAPKIANPNIEYALKILTNLEYSAFHGFPKMFWSIILHKAIFLSLKYGNVPESAYIYTSYGYLLITDTSDYSNAYQFASLGIKLSNQQQHPALKAKVCARYGGYILPWNKALPHALPILEEGFYKGMEGGEPKTASENLAHSITNQFVQGTSLESIRKKIQDQHQFLQKNSTFPANHTIKHYVKLIELLTQPPSHSETQAIHQPIEERFKSLNEEELICLILQFVHGFYDYKSENLISLGNHINEQLDLVKGRLESALFRFFYALLLCRNYAEVPPAQRNRNIQGIIEQQSYLKDWAEHSPENFRQLYTLIYAELSRLRGNKWEASEYYDQSIILSRQQGYLHIEALGNELAGKYWISLGKQEFARAYIQKATFLYEKWGAKYKCNKLQEQFPQFFHVQSSHDDTTSSVTDIDQLTLLQASQTLSGEIVLSNLLEKLMRIVIANAGAVHGAFFTLNGQSLILRAEGDLRSGIDVSRTLPLSSTQHVAQSAVLYVQRTRQELVLIDACREEPFNHDPYIAQKEVLSVACLPVIYKDKLSAVIYLENDLITGAFTNKRLEILRILTAQIAISLENASFYEKLEEKVSERTSALDEKNRALGVTLEKLKQTQAQLVDSAKMASLGQLTAGIAHEINNPLNFISANIKPLKLDFEDLKSLFSGFQALQYAQDKESGLEEVLSHAEEIDAEFLFQEMENLLHGIEEGALRTKKIVEGLRTFSFGGNESFQNVNIHEGIDATLMLLTNKWKNHISIQKNYDQKLPHVSCIPGKLNQVFMNILQNAMQAINERIEIETEHQGTIEITTRKVDDMIEISFWDNGTGMKKEILTRIFEPFFTTRDVGEGTGLGLSITFGIIEQHQGKLEVQSKWMNGSRFVIKLPNKESSSEMNQL